MGASGPYFLGRPRFFFANGSPMPGSAATPLPPAAPVADMLERGAAAAGWKPGGAAPELTGANTGVPSVVYAMRTLCMAAEDGGATGAGWLFGKPNRSLPAISPCSDLTSMAGSNRFLDESTKRGDFYTAS